MVFILCIQLLAVDPVTQSLLSRLEDCDASELSLVHQGIYNLPAEDLKERSLELIPQLFASLLTDQRLTSLQPLEYVVSVCSPKEAIIALLELSCQCEDTFNMIAFLVQHRLLALAANSLPADSQTYCLYTQNRRLLELVSQWSEECGEEEEANSKHLGVAIEWFLSLTSVFEIDFHSYSLKLINSKQANRFRLNYICVCVSLFLSSLAHLQQSLYYTHVEIPMVASFQLWLLGLYISFLEFTAQDFCYHFLFNNLVRIGLKPSFLLTNSDCLYPLFVTVESGFKGEEQESFNKFVRLGMAHYTYLAIHKGLLIGALPLCYSPVYLQESSCAIAAIFLPFSSPHITAMGLNLLERVSHASVELGTHCEWSTYGDICYALTQVMVSSDEEAHRKLAVRVFERMFRLYCSPLLHWLYKYLLWRVTHSPVSGFLVTLLKEQVSLALSDTAPQQHRLYFSGGYLQTLLQRVIKLSSREHSQVSGETDSILSTLNLLRYLLLRDSRGTNRTHVWNLILKVESYCSKLNHLAIQAIAFYRKELEISAAQSKSRAPNDAEIQMELSINHTITKLSLMLDVNARLTEIIADSN